MPIPIGRNLETGVPVVLDTEILRTHMHLVGATGTGKSTALLSILHSLITDAGPNRCCLFLIDPIGNLSRDLLNFIAHPKFCPEHVRDRLVYIEPANEQYVIPFNPLAQATEATRYYLAMRAVDIVLRAWEAQDVAQQPRLLQWSYKAFCAVAALGFPIAICRYLLHPGTPEHKALLDRIPGEIRNHWVDILRGQNEATRILESTRNRLDPFYESPHLRRMFGTRMNLFDCARFITERKIVILNLGEYGRIPSFIADTIGGLAINEILESARILSTSSGRRTVDPTYVVMDEFHRFVGQDIEHALPTVRQMGLRLIMAHQSFSQLEREDVDLSQMIWQARSRLIFANSARDADIVADELAKLTFDNMKIKDRRTNIKQLIRGYRKEWMESESGTETRSNAEMDQNSVGSGNSLSETFPPNVRQPTKSRGRNDSTNRSTGSTSAASSSETHGRSQANVPIHETFEEVTNLTFESFDEFALKWGRKIRRLRTGNALATFPNDDEIHSIRINALLLEETRSSLSAVKDLVARNYSSEFFISGEAADRELEECRRLLLQSPKPHHLSQPDSSSDDRSPPEKESPFR